MVNLSAESTIEDIGAVLSALIMHTSHKYPGLKPWAEIERTFSALLTIYNLFKESGDY